VRNHLSRESRTQRTLGRIVLALTAVLLLPSTGYSSDPPLFTSDTTAKVYGVIVKVKPGFLSASSPMKAGKESPAQQVTEWTKAAGVAQARVLWQGGAPGTKAVAPDDHPGKRTFVLAPDAGTKAEDVFERIRQLPWVEYAELDRLLTLHSAPNDPLYNRQWHLENKGQPYWSVVGIPGSDNDTIAELTGTAGADVKFRASHDYTGPKSPVRVCIIDTGIDTDHEDLADRLFLTPGEIPDNGLDDDHNGFIDDVYGWDFSGDTPGTPSDVTPDNDVTDTVGHGTHVAGTIAATGNNALGVAGVADSAYVFAAKIFPNAFFSIAAQAIYYAVLRGARVVNMSWGGPYPSNALRDALDYANDHGLVLIASMGNSGGEDVLYPSGYEATIGVGASTANDHLARFSTYNSAIDIIAPGQDVLSLRASETDMYAPGGEPNIHIIDKKYYIASGTSMAAPHASGAAAALLSIAPGLSNTRVREILTTTADDIIDPYGDGASLPGYDIYTGWGRINLSSAIAALPGVFAVISEPQTGAWISGIVDITGHASGSGFSSYTVQIAPGHDPDPADWTTIATSSVPVSAGTLAVWDTDGLEGPYTIRLDAGTDAVFDVPVQIIQQPTAVISSPVASETVKLATTIMGTAAATDFVDYRLDAIGPLPSSVTTPIGEFTRPVWDDTLAIWELTQLSPGDYWLRLSVETGSGTFRDSISVSVEDIFHPGWPVTLPANSHFAVTAVDIDGNGTDEIVCPTNKGLWVLTDDGEVYPGWPRDTLVNHRTPPAFADLDNDGRYEIIVATPDSMRVYTWIGEQYYRWPRPFAGASNYYGVSLPTVGDINGDGQLEIAAIDRDGNIRVWYEDGTAYEPSVSPFGQVNVEHSIVNALPRAVICDLDRDNRAELIAVGDEIRIFDGETGLPYKNLSSSLVASHFSIQGLVIGDFNNDPRRDLAYVAVDEPTGDFFVNVITVAAITKNDKSSYDTVLTLPGWPRYLPASQDKYLLYSMAAGDLDRDWQPEIFLAPYSLGEGLLYAYHADGTPVVSDSGDGLFARLPGSASSVAVVDIDSDTDPEVVLRVGELISGPDKVYAYEADGSFVTGYPVVFGSGSSTTLAAPIVADIDADGYADMVTLQSTGTSVTVWDLVNPYGMRGMQWPRFQGNFWNSGVMISPLYDALYMTRIIELIFEGGNAFPMHEPSDLNCDGQTDVLDLTLMIDYLFANGAAPCLP
jgi:subtilisin family serine protease